MLKKFLGKILKGAKTIGIKKLNELEAKNPWLVKLANIFILAGFDVGGALLDKDKDNAAQLQKILKVHTNSIIEEGAALAQGKIDDFTDETLATAATVYLDGAQNILKSLIDDNPDNQAQVKEILEAYKARLIGSALDLVTEKASVKIREKLDPVLAEVVIEILQSLDEMLGEEN